MLGKSSLAWPLAGTMALLSAGCGKESKPDLEVAQQSVRTALDAWKQGDSAQSLKTGPSPIEFYDDDWQNGARLLDYQLTKTYRDTDGGPRCATTLTVQPRRGKPEKIEITYQVNTDPKIVIARDPFS